MRKINKNQRGFAHLSVLVVAVLVVGAVGFAGANIYNKQANAEVLGAKQTKTTQAKQAKKQFKRTKIDPSGTIQYIVQEQTKNAAGKVAYVAKGNIAVSLTTTSKNARCRDAGKMYVRDGDVVFSGNTDADKDHAKNLGKIRIDACTVGKFTATVTPPTKYEVVGQASRNIAIVNNKPIKVTFILKQKETAPAPTPAPKPSATVPITSKQEIGRAHV